jgi:hypothetical protein
VKVRRRYRLRAATGGPGKLLRSIPLNVDPLNRNKAQAQTAKPSSRDRAFDRSCPLRTSMCFSSNASEICYLQGLTVLWPGAHDACALTLNQMGALTASRQLPERKKSSKIAKPSAVRSQRLCLRPHTPLSWAAIFGCRTGGTAAWSPS